MCNIKASNIHTSSPSKSRGPATALIANYGINEDRPFSDSRKPSLNIISVIRVRVNYRHVTSLRKNRKFERDKVLFQNNKSKLFEC